MKLITLSHVLAVIGAVIVNPLHACIILAAATIIGLAGIAHVLHSQITTWEARK